MACVISIISVTGSQNGPNTIIVVNGTISGCTTGIVNLFITCGAQTFSGQGTFSFGAVNWQGSIPTTCVCNGPVTVTASCSNDPNCTTIFTVANLLCCCPQINLTLNENPVCLPVVQSCLAGRRQVQFVITGNVPPGCSASLQINYGDSTVSQVYPLSSGPINIIDYHIYCVAVGPYFGVVSINSPTSCPGVGFQYTATPCPPCTLNTWTVFLCGLIQALILLFATLAASYFAVPLCPGALGFAVVYSILAIALFFVFTDTSNNLQCINCSCSPYIRWLGMVVFASGICMILFIGILCDPLPFWMPIVTIVTGLLIISFWYQFFYQQCSLTICHFWNFVRLSAFLAVAAIVIIYFSISGITILNLAIAGVVALLFILFSTNQISNNLPPNPNNCLNYP